jgi:ferredoxin
MRVASAEPTVKLVVQQKDQAAVELTVESGEQLRAALIANKVDLYTTWGKIMSCGGGGSCGTCVVDVSGLAAPRPKRRRADLRPLPGVHERAGVPPSCRPCFAFDHGWEPAGSALQVSARGLSRR